MLAGWAVVRSAGVVPGTAVYLLWMAIGLAALLGHMFSLFLKFRGGKGVATTAGILLGLWPFYTLPALVMIGVFAVVRYASGYVSLGSMLAAATFPVSYIGLGLAAGVGARSGRSGR